MRRHPLAAAATDRPRSPDGGVVLPGTTATAATKSLSGTKAVGGFKHIVVIYEENHSFDNLYGGWGKVGARSTAGPRPARRRPSRLRRTATRTAA